MVVFVLLSLGFDLFLADGVIRMLMQSVNRVQHKPVCRRDVHHDVFRPRKQEDR